MNLFNVTPVVSHTSSKTGVLVFRSGAATEFKLVAKLG